MARFRTRIAVVKCRRGCGRSVATLTRAIHTSEAVRQKWGGICEACMTDAEREELQRDAERAVRTRLGG